MIKFLYPTKDCTLYSKYDLLNSGADEILELSSLYNSNNSLDIARILIEFDQTELDKFKNESCKFFLNLKITEKVELDESIIIEIFPLAVGWTSGKGRFSDTEFNYKGASWSHRNSNGEPWKDTHSEIEDGGGNWYSQIQIGEYKKSLSREVLLTDSNKDIRVDISDLVKLWTSNNLENNGLILKFKDDTLGRFGNLKFFSNDTNTIYGPYLEVGVFDYIFDVNENNEDENTENINSGSLDSGSLDSGSLDSGSKDTQDSTNKKSSKLLNIQSDNIIPTIQNIKQDYSLHEKSRINVLVREEYPQKKFINQFSPENKLYTKLELYYSIRDAETDEIVFDFSEFSKISCDNNGHFFNVDFGCLKQGRYYKFLTKLKTKNTEQIFNDSRRFTISR